jgi:hypothetical protein
MLADRIKGGPISVKDFLKLALQIAEALEAAHEKGVIHGGLHVPGTGARSTRRCSDPIRRMRRQRPAGTGRNSAASISGMGTGNYRSWRPRQAQQSKTTHLGIPKCPILCTYRILGDFYSVLSLLK